MIRLSHDGIASEADYRDVSRRLVQKRQLNDAEWERMTGLFMRDMISQADDDPGDCCGV